MKCRTCKAEWNVPESMGVSITNCPFCGALLAVDVPKETLTFQDVIKAIIDHGGIDILLDGRKSLAMFSDISPKLRKEKTMFSYLVQCEGNRILVGALKKSTAEQTLLRKKVVQLMIDELLVSESVAYSTCDSFWEAIGGEVIRSREDSAKQNQRVAEKNTAEFESIYRQVTSAMASLVKPSDFKTVEDSLVALGSYRDAPALLLRVRQEREKRVSKANELYSVYVNHTSDKQLEQQMYRELCQLQQEKSDVQEEQQSKSELKEKLEECRRKKNELSQEIADVKKNIQGLSSQSRGFWSGKAHAVKLEEANNKLRRLEEAYKTACRDVATTQDAINSIPAEYQARISIENINSQIFQKMQALDPIQKRIAAFPETRRMILDPQYLYLLYEDPARRRELQNDSDLFREIRLVITVPQDVRKSQKDMDSSKDTASTSDGAISEDAYNKKLIQQLRYSADHGNHDASIELGKCYEKGTIVPKDLNIAEAYYRRAAVSGNHEGEYRLGLLLYKKSSYGAVDWLRKAANAGHQEAKKVLNQR